MSKEYGIENPAASRFEGETSARTGTSPAPLIAFDFVSLMRLLISLIVWIAVVAAGFCCLLRYEHSAGQANEKSNYLPAGTAIHLETNRPTLIMFAHPKCPCTRASLEELNRILARAPGLAAQIWFFTPTGAQKTWAHSQLWQTAATIPGVILHEDWDGTQSRLFGAETSGAVLVYDTNGKLLFSGGITSARGHVGDNEGASAVLACLTRSGASLSHSEVYGCSLVTKKLTASEIGLK